MSAKAAHCFPRTLSEYIQSGPCDLLCLIILCAFFDCIHSKSYIWCFRAPLHQPAAPAVDAGESRLQRIVKDRRKEGREHGSDNQREKYRSVTLTTTHQLQHYTVTHTPTRTHITKRTRSVKIHS